jgi:hypothetical protein
MFLMQTDRKWKMYWRDASGIARFEDSMKSIVNYRPLEFPAILGFSEIESWGDVSGSCSQGLGAPNAKTGPMGAIPFVTLPDVLPRVRKLCGQLLYASPAFAESIWSECRYTDRKPLASGRLIPQLGR